MTSVIEKAIPVTMGLLLLAGSPAFAATHTHDVKRKTHHKEVMIPSFKNQLPLNVSRGDNCGPYICQWLEGYPRSPS